MTYQLGNFTGHCLRATATGQAGQSELAHSLWQRTGAWIAKRSRRPASRSASHGELYPPDWSQQLQRDLLRIQARRIL
jgi:hypothetical protein